MKKALITGITGQDGGHLAPMLLDMGYEVHGIKRRSSSFNTGRIDNLIGRPNFHLHFGDLTDGSSLLRVLEKVRPDEVYNLAAQSHVAVSFEIPEYTTDTIAMGTLRLLEAIRSAGLENTTHFYQASTSELYGKVLETPQSETTPFNPQSPYAIAKLHAFHLVRHYREAYNMYACNGILFNHESELRGETFVTRKITMAVARMFCKGDWTPLALGNLSAMRDWGYAGDYVKGMYLMLQQEKPDDFVLATGVTTTIRDFCKFAFKYVGIKLVFQGEGVDEVGVDSDTGTVLVKVDPKYFRPAEVDLLLGDASKARRVLGWEPTANVEALCQRMMLCDIARLTNHSS